MNAQHLSIVLLMGLGLPCLTRSGESLPTLNHQSLDSESLASIPTMRHHQTLTPYVGGFYQDEMDTIHLWSTYSMKK